MRIVSVNAGLPRVARWKGGRVRTAIFKEPVSSPVAVGRLGLEGDGQADLRVHGGPARAVYAYPAQHYPLWRCELDLPGLSFGMFGENLTVEGLDEEAVRIGDRFRAGTAVIEATGPRLPCFKLALRLEREAVVERMLATGRTGVYFAVVREGIVAAGDRLELMERAAGAPTVAETARARSRTSSSDASDPSG